VGHRRSVTAVFSAQSDPTGFSSTTGQLLVAAMLLTVLIVLIRWWRQKR
jgi:hypothetical protein